MKTELALLAALATVGHVAPYSPDIPVVWNDRDVATFEVPLATPERSPRHVSSEAYYGFPVRTIYRSYPIYRPDRAPEGYEGWLREREPEVAFDPDELQTEADWIEAGARVFRAPIFLVPWDRGGKGLFANPEFYEALGVKTDPDGVVPYAEIVIREKGKLELGLFACATCHSRVLPSGEVLRGAQGDFPVDHMNAFRLELLGYPEEGARSVPVFFSTPWIRPEEYRHVTSEERARLEKRIPAGVMARQGTSLTHPPKIPSLIGIKDRRYLDASGLVRHRDIGDLMRYAAMTQGLDLIAHYGDFQPSPTMAAFIGPGDAGQQFVRYSDEQLYALARYLYVLEPPENPHAVNDETRRGEAVFNRAGCNGCHTAPLYTNNMLLPAPGFDVPEGAEMVDAILAVDIGTDPTLATETRRGTGYYKVPSLRGVWFRDVFGHNGQAASLEEWLDPSRLDEGYVPKSPHVKPGPIEGHAFGLELSEEDREALIAFLRTL